MTTSSKLSLKLKELGVSQQGEYYWVEEWGKEVCVHKSQTQGGTINEILCRALTLGELVRELPARVSIDKLTTGFLAYTYDEFGDIDINYQSHTPEEAVGELLVDILKQTQTHERD